MSADRDSTGFFVLGLLSQTSVGAETLEEYGWLSTRDSSGRPTGLCLPGSLARFTFVSASTQSRAWLIVSDRTLVAAIELPSNRYIP